MVDSSYGEKWESLLSIMRRLRAPGGCPWDREQTHRSIRRNLVEEAYEVIDAIESGGDADLCEELGDVLLQVVFHAVIAEEEGRFDIGDVLGGICGKLTERHPHVFGEAVARTSDEVLENWEKIKRETKGHRTPGDSLGAVPKSFPALMRAGKLVGRAEKAGISVGSAFFDGQDGSGEGQNAENGKNTSFADKKPNKEREFGQKLFVLVKEAIENGVDPELALQEICDGLVRSAYTGAADGGGTGLGV